MSSTSQRTRRSPDEAKAAIFAAAEDALSEHDFSDLTVETVTRRAGMTRSAFYHYFSGLDEIAMGLLKRFEADVRATVDPWLDGKVEDLDYREAMVRHLTDMFRVFPRHRRMISSVSQAASGSRKVFEHWQGSVIDYYVEKTASFIRHQIALGRSKVTDVDRVARSLILMNYSVGIDDLRHVQPDDPERTAQVVGRIWNLTIYGDD
ncbi:MAG: TetR/AcrR family transcriptional regulator [Pseudomonadota bacterium]